MNTFKHQSTSLTPGITLDAQKDLDANKRLIGTYGNDSIHGSEADEHLRGLKGDDELIGRAGNDALHGGQDNDRLTGGSGDNTLQGGPGQDTFVVGDGFDTIEDFNPEKDTIELSGDYQVIADGNDSRIEWSDTGNSVVVIGINPTELNINS